MIESIQSEKDRDLQEDQFDKQQEVQKQQIKQQSKETQNQTPKAAGRPKDTTSIPVNAAKQYNQKNIQKTIYAIEDLQDYMQTNFKKHKNLTDINDNQINLISKLCESVVCAKEKINGKEQY